MATEARQRQEKLLDLGSGIELWRVHVDDLKEQLKNARTMDPQAFVRLTQNIGKHRRLESLPLCALDDQGDLSIVSGHHRVRACRAANVLTIHVLVDVTGLSKSQIVAKQLAHNAIQGSDDNDILAQLYREMDSIEDMLESAVDPNALGLQQPLEPLPLQEIRVAFETKQVTFAFLPTQLDDLKRLCDNISADADFVGALPLEFFERFTQAMRDVGRQCEIRSVGAIVSRMIDLALAWLEQQSQELSECQEAANPS